jgi:hypothetical protein
MLEKQMTRPTARPTRTARGVKERPGITFFVGLEDWLVGGGKEVISEREDWDGEGRRGLLLLVLVSLPSSVSVRMGVAMVSVAGSPGAGMAEDEASRRGMLKDGGGK